MGYGLVVSRMSLGHLLAVAILLISWPYRDAPGLCHRHPPVCSCNPNPPQISATNQPNNGHQDPSLRQIMPDRGRQVFLGSKPRPSDLRTVEYLEKVRSICVENPVLKANGFER
jgi:hypothetical protein